METSKENSQYSTINEKKIAIVVAKFNSFITDALLQGAKDTLINAGFSKDNISTFPVAGAFEIPLICDLVLDKYKVDGVIALGAIIRGETPHFDFVATECARGTMEVSLSHKKPVAFGVLTTDNVEQALNRAGLKDGNKGADACHALLDQLNLIHEHNL